MAGERRPRPDDQVRQALAVAKSHAIPWDTAWPIATHGQVCDSYASARGTAKTGTPPPLDGPPDFRTSDGQQRCAGCRFVAGAGNGLARCTLYSVDVFAGVLWPHRTQERHEWRNAILGDPDDTEDLGTMPEWHASYEDQSTAYSLLHEMLREKAAGVSVDEAVQSSATLAA